MRNYVDPIYTAKHALTASGTAAVATQTEKLIRANKFQVIVEGGGVVKLSLRPRGSSTYKDVATGIEDTTAISITEAYDIDAYTVTETGGANGATVYVVITHD